MTGLLPGPYLVTSSKHSSVFIARVLSKDYVTTDHATMAVSGTWLGLNSGTHPRERETHVSYCLHTYATADVHPPTHIDIRVSMKINTIERKKKTVLR